jgi:hypothetical protein
MSAADEASQLLKAFQTSALAIAPLDSRLRLRVVNALCVLIGYDIEAKLATPEAKDEAADTIARALLNDDVDGGA